LNAKKTTAFLALFTGIVLLGSALGVFDRPHQDSAVFIPIPPHEGITITEIVEVKASSVSVEPPAIDSAELPIASDKKQSLHSNARRSEEAQVSAASLEDGVERWRPLVAKYFAPEHIDRALRVMICESHGDPNAFNGFDRGLFQIEEDDDDLFIPEVNVAEAARKADRGRTFASWDGPERSGRGERRANTDGCPD